MDPPGYRRRRPPKSCIECRRRKVRCDQKRPCAQCTTSGASCAYRTRENALTSRRTSISAAPNGIGPTRASPDDAAPSLRQPLEQLRSSRGLSDRHTLLRPNVPPSPIQEESTAQTFTSGATSATQPDEDVLQAPQFQAALLADPALRTSQAVRQLLNLKFELEDGQLSKGKRRVVRWQYWAGAPSPLGILAKCYMQYLHDDATRPLSHDPELQDVVLTIRGLIARCKTIAHVMKLARPTRGLSIVEFRPTPPLRDFADAMIESYCSSFESIYRILHVPTFRANYERYWSDPATFPIDLSLQILLVIAIGFGLRDTSSEPVDLRPMLEMWIYTAQMWLSGPLEKDRLDVSGVQVCCLTILAREVLSVGGDLVWISAGSLVHRAMQIGLHHDPRHFRGMSTLDAELRRRLWWTIMEMTVQSSLDAAMPARISLDHFDTDMPSNLDDDEIAMDTPPVKSHPSSMYTSTSIQLMLCQSFELRLRAVELLSGLKAELSYLDVLALTAEINSACQMCTLFADTHCASGVTAFHRNLLDYMVRRALLALHCPFAGEAHANPLFWYSLKLGVDTVFTILSPVPDESFSNLRLSGGGMIKSGFRMTFLTLSIALLAQVESQRQDGSLANNSGYLAPLKQATRDMIGLSLERLKRGETNVKSHMFICMILAQAEAMESQDPRIEQRIAQSAKASLELCHDLLNSRLENSTISPPDFAELSASAGTASSYSPDDLWNMASDMGFLFT